jgi:hypothetical protein
MRALKKFGADHYEMSETEHGGGNYKFNEGGIGPKTVFTQNHGLYSIESNNTHVSLLKYNEGRDHYGRISILYRHTDLSKSRSCSKV